MLPPAGESELLNFYNFGVEFQALQTFENLQPDTTVTNNFDFDSEFQALQTLQLEKLHQNHLTELLDFLILLQENLKLETIYIVA